MLIDYKKKIKFFNVRVICKIMLVEIQKYVYLSGTKVMQRTLLVNGTLVTTSGSTHQHIVALIHFMATTMHRKTTTTTLYLIYWISEITRSRSETLVESSPH